MSFMDKLKAANGFNLGAIESPDFPCGKIIMSQGVPHIINGALNGRDYDVPIRQQNIKVFKLVGCGAGWAKYLLVFKDGKSGYITQDVLTDAQKRGSGTTISIAPIERFIRYVDLETSARDSASAQDTASQHSANHSAPTPPLSTPEESSDPSTSELDNGFSIEPEDIKEEKSNEKENLHFGEVTSTRAIILAESLNLKGSFVVAQSDIVSASGKVKAGTLGKVLIWNPKEPLVLFENNCTLRCPIKNLVIASVKNDVSPSAVDENATAALSEPEDKEAVWPVAAGQEPITPTSPLRFGDYVIAKQDVSGFAGAVQKGTLGKVTVENPREPEITFQNGIVLRCEIVSLVHAKIADRKPSKDEHK